MKSLKLPWRTFNDLGWAILTGSISDIVSKGGIPYACMISLGLPLNMKLEELEEMVLGLEETANYYGVRILGGDTNSSSEAWVSVVTIGFTTAKKPPSRKGLEPGDSIIVTGIYGAMGYVAKHGIEHSMNKEWVVKYTKKPTTRLELGYLISNNYKAISASMDVSDGLGYTLETLSSLSNRGIQIEKPPLTPPQLLEHCNNDPKCLLDYALIGGEEYGVVMGVKSQWLNNVIRELEYYEIPYSIIGRVIDAEPGLYYNEVKIHIKRYDQFKGWA